MNLHARPSVLAALAFAALLVLPQAAMGQGRRPGTGRARVRVSLSQTVFTFPAPGVADFDAGWVDGAGLVVSVLPRRNQGPWELRIRAAGPDMGGYGKPVSDVLWRTAGSSSWTPLAGTDQAVIQGTGDQTVILFLRLRLDYAMDEPGAYTADLSFYAETI